MKSILKYILTSVLFHLILNNENITNLYYLLYSFIFCGFMYLIILAIKNNNGK